MKIVVLQPLYPRKPDCAKDCLQSIIQALEDIKEADLIVLPEYANAPGLNTREEIMQFAAESTSLLWKACINTAQRCHAMVAVNMVLTENGLTRNTTVLFDRTGNPVFRYYKQHLPYAEKVLLKLDSSYTKCGLSQNVCDLDGIRFGFMTCYDIYFGEYIDQLAGQNVDILLLPAYQRGERVDMLEAEAKIAAARCNAFMIRSSYSMGESSGTGGCSMVVAPDGRIIEQFGQQTGILLCEIEPKTKHLRSNGFGQSPVTANQFIEQGRTPWAYRPCGPALRPGNSQTPYPRLCAHRGINTIAPENTMPALAAAVALGAEEIEFDLWASKDGELIVTHDPTVERTSDGQGQIWDLTYDEIARLDTGSYFSPHLRGLRFLRFEEVLQRLSRQVIMNIHIKSPVTGAGKAYDDTTFRKITALIERYDCIDHCYIAGDADVLQTALTIAPHLSRACLAGQTDYTLVDKAIQFQCQILQLYKPYFNQQMIDKAHAHGIRCNVFWSDEAEEAKRFLDMGIDTILTNDYLALKTDLAL